MILDEGHRRSRTSPAALAHIEPAQATPERPRYGSIEQASKHFGLSRSSLYVEAGRNPGLFRKWGTKVQVDFDMLDRVLDAMPIAQIKPQPKRVYRKKHAAGLQANVRGV